MALLAAELVDLRSLFGGAASVGKFEALGPDRDVPGFDFLRRRLLAEAVGLGGQRRCSKQARREDE